MGRDGFLFTDIEGSTVLLERLGSAYADLLGQHHHILRSTAARHAGEEIGGEGDSLAFRFPQPDGALRAARVIQSAVSDARWPAGLVPRIRMGLHCGAVMRIERGYVGLALHEASRICSAAHGGQILASTDFVDAVNLPDKDRLPMGEHRLRGLTASYHLWQISCDNGHPSFPPLRTEQRRHRLPPLAGTLFGRDEELAELERLAQSHRFLALLGPAGVGKTRLALEFAQLAAANFRDGVALIELDAASSSEDISLALSRGLQFALMPTASGDHNQQLIELLRPQQLIIVLDAVEAVLAETAALSERLLSNCPGLVVVVTSRERLPSRVAVAVSLQPWPTTSHAGEPPLAAQFIRQRLQEFGGPTLVVDDDLIEVCQLLDGLPLALELAAPALSALPAKRVADSLRSGGGLHRFTHPSMADALVAAIRRSYDGCSPAEQRLLRWMSAFRASMELETLERFAPIDRTEDFLDAIAGLSGKSLVAVDRTGEVARYRLLSTIAEFGRNESVQRGEEAAMRQARRVMAAHLVARAPSSMAEVTEEGLNLLARVMPDLRIALDEALVDADRGGLVALVPAMAVWWLARGNLAEAKQKMLAAAEIVDDGDDGLRLAAVATRVLLNMGEVDAAAGPAGRAALLAEHTEDPLLASIGFGAAGMFAADRGNAESAGQLLKRALVAAQSSGDRSRLGVALHNAALHAQLTGDSRRARALIDQGLAAVGDLPSHLRAALWRVDALARDALGEPGAAETAVAALSVFSALGEQLQSANCLEVLALITARTDPMFSAEVLGAADAIRDRTGAARRDDDHAEYEETLGRIAETLGADTGRAIATGRDLSVDDILARVVLQSHEDAGHMSVPASDAP